jgi:integrase
MPRLLTSRFVETVRPLPKLKEYPDPSGVRLVVYPTGHKSFIHRYRVDGTPTKDTLGRAIGEGAITLAAAREAVAKTRRQLEQGVAPPRPVLASSGDSVASHAAAFLTKHHVANNRQSTADAAELTFSNSVLPAWGNRAVQDVRRRDVIALVEATAVARGPEAAVHLLRTLSKFFGWLLARDVIETTPCLGVAGVLPQQGKPRQRVLDHQTELLPLLKAANTDHPADRAVAVLIYSGQRRNEVGGMRWSELDRKARVWIIPAERSKNHHAHRVPLPTQAWAIIDAQPRIAGCDFVFTATGRVPVNGWDEVKKRLAAAAGLVEDWRLHDLRRTCASGMQRLGVRTEVIERALNHRSGVYRGIAGVYQTDLLESEVRAALQMWSDYLEELSAQKAVGKRRSGRAG